jgi:hypothetical protein
MPPGDIEFDRPVPPAKASRGRPHSGLSMRGNSMNSTIVSGTAFSAIMPTSRSLCPAGRSSAFRLTLTRTKNRAMTAPSVISATGSAWLCMNCVSRMKKHRNTTTNTSRVARSSSSFSASSSSRKVTPASRPSSVRY